MWGLFTKPMYKNLQKKIVGVVTFASKTDHSDPIFANLEFCKIDGIRQLQLLSFVYDCQNKAAPLHFHDYFKPCSQVHRSTLGWHPVVIFSLKEEIHFNMELGPLSLLVRGYGTCASSFEGKLHGS